MANNRLRVEEAKKKLQERLAARFEGRRQTAVAVVSSVERDPKSGYTTGKIRATIDGVADQSVFVGAGTGVAVGESLRVENRAGGIGPEWVSLGKTGSVAGSEGTVDTGRPLSTPTGLSLSSSTYAAGTAVAARITVQWNQIGDWEGAANYEIAYYRDADGAANQHVSNAPHVNGQTAVQYAILSLLPGTAYSVKVRAVGYGGSLSSWTATSSHTTATDASVPGAPTGLGANQVSDTALRFYWARSVESDFSHYEIGVSSTASTPLLSGYPLSTGDTPEHIHNVTPATNRYFRVRAIDTSGNASAWSSFAGPFFTTETVTGSLVLGDIINQSYGLGLLGDPEKIIIDLATASGLAFEGGTGNLMLADSVAGAGLTVTDKVLAVGQGLGLTVNANDVALTTPGTLTVSTANSSTGSHLHAVTSSSNPGAAASLLATDASGYLNLVRLNTDTLADRSGGNLTIAPTGDVVFDPTGNDILPNVGYDLNIGALSKKYLTLHAAELWVETLVAQDTIATIGGRILVGPTTTLIADLTAGATTIDVKHNQIANGDRVYMEANGLLEFMAVTSGPTTITGGFRYTVTRNLDGTGANQWYAGDAIFNTGTTGSGFIDLYSQWSVNAVGIDYLYNYNNTGAAYSTNYSNYSTVTLLGDSANTEVNDALYVGRAATTANWTALTFKIGTAAVYTATLLWEYWNGSAWTSFTPTVTLNGASTATALFKATGQWLVTFGTLSGWANTTVNGASALWVRLRISAFTSFGTAPVQNGRTVRANKTQFGPTIVGNVRNSTTFNDWSEHWAIGNLNGLYGYGVDTYGTAFGKYASGQPWISVDATNGFRINNYSSVVGQWATDGSWSISGNGTNFIGWDPGTAKLTVEGTIAVSQSEGAGGGGSNGEAGGLITVSDYGMIQMGTNSVFDMGASSTFTAAAGSTFTIGTQGTGAYLSYVNGVLNIEGMLTVTDGADFLPAEYRPASISASFETNFVTGTTWNLWGALPYGDDGGYVAGRMETANGNIYTLLTADTVDSTGSRYIKITVRKTRLVGDYTSGSIAYPNTIYIPGTSCITCNNYTDAEWTALSEAERNNRVIIADAYLNADFSDVVSVSFRAESGISIITPDFIRTPNLSSLSANLGSVTAGSIVVGSTNKLWLNDDATAPTVALAIGGSTKASAPFLVYEDGDFHAGGSMANYLDWNGTTLTVKGTIQADAGQINGNLTLESSGNLRMNGGKIQWQNDGGTYRSYIDNSKIVISEASGYSITRIGDTGQDGLIDVDMFNTAQGVWKYGVHITDGGNSLPNVSALFHGQTAIGANAVDRIFNASAVDNGGSLNTSDGFYADIEGGTWNNFASTGVAFKGQTDFSPAVLALRRETSGYAPAVWAQSMSSAGAAYSAVIGASNQTAFYVDNTLGGTGIVALQTNGGKIIMGYGRIEQVGRFSLQSGNYLTGSAATDGGLGGDVLHYWRIEIEGVGTFSIPLFHENHFL